MKTITTGAGSRRLALSPAGDRVFVTNYLDNSVSVIDTRTQKLIATIPVGINPRGIAITPSGDAIYVTNVHDGTVSIIDSATLTVINTITVGAKPWQILITKDGTRAFVSNSGIWNRFGNRHRDATGHPDAQHRTRPLLFGDQSGGE